MIGARREAPELLANSSPSPSGEPNPLFAIAWASSTPARARGSVTSHPATRLTADRVARFGELDRLGLTPPRPPSSLSARLDCQNGTDRRALARRRADHVGELGDRTKNMRVGHGFKCSAVVIVVDNIAAFLR
jgi:hypothetical protein